MSNTPIKFSNITQALQTAFENDNNTKNYTIVRSESVNADPTNAAGGWLGIYRSRVDYDPRTLGKGGRNFRGDVFILLVAQITSLESGEDAEDRLEEMVENIIQVVFNDLSVKSTLSTITGLTVTYSYNRTKEASMYFQEAIIEVNGVTET